MINLMHLSMLSCWGGGGGGGRPGIDGGFDRSYRPVVGLLSVLMAFLATFY